MLKEELAAQRVFLSSDEAAALSRAMSYDDESDLAWERIKSRRLTFFAALRDRFIRDRRPVDAWREMIAAEEAAGEPTFVSHIASQVVEWSIRTSDRGAMLAGFTARALLWLGALFVLLGGYAWLTAGTPETGGGDAAAVAAAIVGGAGIAFVAASRVVARIAAHRTASVLARSRRDAAAA